MKIKCDLTSHGAIFERIYVCLEASKSAFATTCRPLIGLDGCFVKGEYGGQLLSAIGKDGNNQMFPMIMLLWNMKIICLGSDLLIF